MAACAAVAAGLVSLSAGVVGASVERSAKACTISSVPQFTATAGGVAGAIVDVAAPVGARVLGSGGAGAWARPGSVITWHGARVVVLDLAIPADARPGAYAGSVRLSCGAPVPVVVHVADPNVATARRDGGTVGLGAVPVVRAVAGGSGGAAVLVQNPGAAVTLGGTGDAGRWVVPVAIARGAEREIKVLVSVPTGTRDGRYVGALVLSLAPPVVAVLGDTATAVVGYRVVQPLVVIVSG
ncbi:MAG: hypothetical protein ACYCTE_17160 [Acidimicrobiales bacterium]